MTAASETVTVTTEPAPEIEFFRVTPSTFSGASADASVTWTAKGTLTLTANGQPVASFPGTETGTITVTISDTTTFQLTAAGAGIEVSETRLVAKTEMEMEPNDDAMSAQALTGSAIAGSLADANDVDWYSFSVPANGNVFVQVNDETGDCSDTADVFLVDTDGMNDLGGTGFNDGCFNITPQRQSFAAQLAAGTYFVRVESLFGGSGPYTLVVLVNGPGCGNGILENSVGEQCDDGNTNDGDGCSSTCQVQPSGTVMGIGQDMTFTGAIDPATNQDFFEVILDAPGNIFAETGVPTLGICEGDGMRDTRVYLLDSAFAELGDNDDGGPGLCSSIDPNFDDFAAGLAAGTYYLRVQSFGGASRIPSYELRVRTTQATGCGNGVVEEGETCDDFNTMNNDGCDMSCQIEVAGTLNMSGSVPVTLGTPMDLPRWVSVNIAQGGSTITATITDGMGGCPFATDMGLLNADLSMTFGGRNGDGGCAYFGPPEDTFSQDLAAGKYMIGLRAAEGTGGQVTVEVTITPPQCGNNTLETNAGEQCDDGNTTPMDGCDANCQFENVTSEVEPNNMPAMANATGATRGGPVVTLTGNIDPLADHDYYSFSIPSGQTATLEALTYGAFGDIQTCGFDTVLTVFDSAGMVVTENDDADRGLCSTIDGMTAGAANIPAGDYTIRVQAYNDNSTFNGYLLDVRLLP
jgi:cysteine-rich repeat protein